MTLPSEQSYEARIAELESLKGSISLKFYYTIKEKLEQERAAWNDLLDANRNRKRNLAEYSFVLDQQYFEQKFLV